MFVPTNSLISPFLSIYDLRGSDRLNLLVTTAIKLPKREDLSIFISFIMIMPRSSE